MAEEFINDIISGASTSDSSSTETAATTDKSDSVVDTTTGKDQSSNQTKTNNTVTTDVDQSKSSLSVEELASQLGWRADHEGEDAVDATTYILRSKDIQKSMGKHNKDLKDQLSTLNGAVESLRIHNEKVYQADVKKLQGEIAVLKKERKSAIELADVVKVEELDAQIEEIQKDINAPKNDAAKSDAKSNPVYDAWIKDNDWYLKDDEMAKYADTIATQYAGAPLPRIYSLVRQKVQEVFPDKFESTKTTETKVVTGKPKPIGPTSPVDKATNNKGNSASFTKADLTPEQTSIMNQFVRGGIMTEEAYINDIAKMQGE